MTLSGSGTVEFTVADNIASIWLNRPNRLNAVVPALVDDLIEALDTVGESNAGAVILAGNGRAFCAGHDLKEPTDHTDPLARLERLQQVTVRLKALPQPVIAAVHGYAIGAGAECALGCDLVIAADDATFAFPEVGLGLSVTGAASRLLPLLVGQLKAKEIILFGQKLDANSAYKLGLVNSVTPAKRLGDTAREWARALAEHPRRAMTLAKRALDAGTDSSVDSALDLEVAHAMITDGSPDVLESTQRFRSGETKQA